ncbi:MspA family porin [Rhodococcus marinonascens]|uniref:MspA family porin n=1 Tax=Rhodococcus marinonascens TaxID=38311 RepID=UPI0009353583|nr:MspA family porin [Rhodococcus marinonascens]
MTNMNKSRLRFTRAIAVAGITALGVVMGNGTAPAAVDNENSVQDVNGNHIRVVMGDTNIQGVMPLDSSPLSVEFFHDGYAGFEITGPNANEFEASELSFGYQIGYPVALGGALVVLSTPSLDWELGANNAIITEVFPNQALILESGTNGALGGAIIPSQEIAIELEPGGITTVPVLDRQPFDGPAALVRMNGMHGSVSGAVGPVTIRPYAMVTTAGGNTAMTYGMPQQLN